ncbi:MAG: VanW family protein [Defluviitaleaceae bacterium]|nr:VanW family protein [Defluviitaleaceae bacterium]
MNSPNIIRHVPQPSLRNPLRRRLGVAYHRLKRQAKWAFGGTKFAKPKSDSGQLPYVHFTHQTPLLRHLVGVDPILEQNKIVNLRLALAKINNTIIHPGETLSFWKLIGKPTTRKGYLDGAILLNGAFSQGLGGGLCHLSGFMYWMALHTPLTVAERHRHGYDTTPAKFFGSDATCFYNYKDLAIKNNTNQTFQLVLEIGDDQLKGIWKSAKPQEHNYEIYEKHAAYHQQDWGRQTRHNHLYRRVFDMQGNQIADEFIAENHAIVM